LQTLQRSERGCCMSYGKVLGKGGNYILAKVNGVKTVVSSSELQHLICDGYDVEVVTPF